MLWDAAADKKCKQRKVVNTEVIEVRPDGKPGVERWTVDRCGAKVNYRIAFKAGPRGGTNFSVELEK